MNIKRIYDLLDVEDADTLWPIAHWSDNELFFEFTEIDEDRFDYQSSKDDERIRLHLKAFAPLMAERSTVCNLEYVAISYDGEYVGLVIAIDGNFGYDVEEMYITNFPKFQAMVAYVRTMYERPPENIVGKTVKIDDLDGRYEYVIDKRFKHNMRPMEKKK